MRRIRQWFGYRGIEIGSHNCRVCTAYTHAEITHVDFIHCSRRIRCGGAARDCRRRGPLRRSGRRCGGSVTTTRAPGLHCTSPRDDAQAIRRSAAVCPRDAARWKRTHPMGQRERRDSERPQCPKCHKTAGVRHENVVQGTHVERHFFCWACDYSWSIVDRRGDAAGNQRRDR